MLHFYGMDSLLFSISQQPKLCPNYNVQSIITWIPVYITYKTQFDM